VGIETMAKRCYIQDMAKTFKVVNGLDTVDPKALPHSRRGIEKEHQRTGMGRI
jgi:hypothetical protein